MNNKLKKGDILSLNLTLSVVKVEGDTVVTEDKDGKRVVFQGDGVKDCKSADLYSSSVQSTRTRIIEIFQKMSPSDVFTVEFVKQDGTLRKLRGKMIKSENGFGRSEVWDLDVKGKRQVDHRTVESLIFDGVKYFIK